MVRKKAKFRKGSWVKTHYGQVGRVYKVYSSFKRTSAGPAWLRAQSKKPKDPTQRWYDVLVASGGAVMIPEEGLKSTKAVPRNKITNVWWNDYFPQKRKPRKVGKTKGGRKPRRKK